MTAQLASSEITKEDVREAVRSCVSDMAVHAREAPDEEVVGAVLRDGTSVRLINEAEAEDQRACFFVFPYQLQDLDVVAIYHSHPNGVEYPSVTDDEGLSPIPAVIVTPTAVILWWYKEHIGYYRIWDNDFVWL